MQDCASLADIGVADEQPIFLAESRGTDGVFDEIIIHLHKPSFK